MEESVWASRPMQILGGRSYTGDRASRSRSARWTRAGSYVEVYIVAIPMASSNRLTATGRSW